MTSYSSYQKLVDLYTLLNMQDYLEYESEKEDDGWIVEIIGDGKVLEKSEIGFGATIEEALNDAAERYFSYTPIVDNVPIFKLLKLLEAYHQSGKNINSL